MVVTQQVSLVIFALSSHRWAWRSSGTHSNPGMISAENAKQAMWKSKAYRLQVLLLCHGLVTAVGWQQSWV